jgi:hypothetical protein
VTIVTAAAREQASWDRWDDNTGFVTFGFEYWDNTVNKFFKDMSGCYRNVTTQVEPAITLKGQ